MPQENSPNDPQNPESTTADIELAAMSGHVTDAVTPQIAEDSAEPLLDQLSEDVSFAGSSNLDQLIEQHTTATDMLQRAERHGEIIKSARRWAIGLALGGLSIKTLGAIRPDLDLSGPFSWRTYMRVGGIGSFAASFTELWNNRKVSQFRQRKNEVNDEITRQFEPKS